MEIFVYIEIVVHVLIAIDKNWGEKQMFNNKMDKQILLYLYNKILFNNVEKNEVLIYTKMSLPVYIE